MIPGIIYRMKWLMADDLTQIEVNIYKMTALIEDSETPQVFNLTPSGTPLNITIIDNERNKFSPIKGRQATLQFISRSGLDFSTFSDEPDNAFYVTVDSGVPERIFEGYLSLADMSQDFLPNPNIVVLTATDHLAMLRDVPFTNDDGSVATGKMRLGNIIALCLKKTGLSLPIRVINNLRQGSSDWTANIFFTFLDGKNQLVFANNGYIYEGQTLQVTGTASNNKTFTVLSVVNGTAIVAESVVDEVAADVSLSDVSSADHFYHGIYLNVDAFSEDDCHTVLSKILGFDCRLTQYNGQWWITRVDEYDGSASNALYVWQFDVDGNVIGQQLPLIEYNKTIARNQPMKFANADNLITADRKLGVAELTYRYKFPSVPCNKEFIKGAEIATITPTQKHYTLDCWKLYRNTPPVADAVVNNTAYIRRLFSNLDYETDRFVVIGIGSVTGFYYIESERIPLHLGDRFNFSVDHKYNGQIETAGGLIRPNIAQIRLYADDGTYWTLFGGNSIDPYPRWVETVSDFTGAGSRFFHTEFDGTEDDTQWRTATFWGGEQCPDAPRSGEITILLIHQLKTDLFEIHFGSLVFDYIPRIDGAYRTVTGQSQKVSREPEDYLAKIGGEVYVSEGQKKLGSGTLLIKNSNRFIYTDITQFSPGQLILPGDVRAIFYHRELRISNTGSNNTEITVINSVYNLGLNRTEVSVSGTITAEINQPAWFHAVKYHLTHKFWPYNVFGGPLTNQQAALPYSEVQIRSVFNQYRNANRIFSGSVKGLYTAGELPMPWPDLIYKFFLQDANPNTNNKIFILTGFEQNWKSGIWRPSLVECFDSTKQKVYDDEREFKFLTNE